MCGTDPELQDYAYCLELHLNEIMVIKSETVQLEKKC